MSRAFSFSVSSVAVSVMVLALAGCQAVPSSSGQPVPLSPVEKQDLSAPTPPSPSSPASLEKRVEALEGQMKAAQPTLKKVDAMETHFKALSLELGRIATTYDMTAAAAPVAPASVKAPESHETKAQPHKNTDVTKKEAPVAKRSAGTSHAETGSLAVTSVRIGEKPKNVTRIVLDTTKAAEIHYDVDNGEGLLVIDVPKAQWKTTDSFPTQKSAMVKSFHATSDDAGSHLVVNLKQAAKVISTARLTPDKSSGNRVYIDIAPVK